MSLAEAGIETGRSGAIADLCRNHPIVAILFQEATQHLLGISATVAVCCINKIYTVLARRIDDPARRPVVTCTAEHHSAETDRRYPEPAVAELPILHLSLRKFLSIGWSDSIRAASALQSCGLAHP